MKYLRAVFESRKKSLDLVLEAKKAKEQDTDQAKLPEALVRFGSWVFPL